MQNLKRVISPKPYIAQAREELPEADGESLSRALSQKLHRDTYECLRSVMAVIAIVLPVVFLVSAFWVRMQGSISAFYHTDMRNVFVGLLFAIGISLYIYKGYNKLENYGLAVAGLFLFGVALVPTGASDGSVPKYVQVIHQICAFSFFGLIAFVCIFARDSGLRATEEFRTAYNITASLMVLVLVAAGVLFLLKKALNVNIPKSTFWVEAAAVWVFAGYWCVKSRELRGLG